MAVLLFCGFRNFFSFFARNIAARFAETLDSTLPNAGILNSTSRKVTLISGCVSGGVSY